MPSTVRYGAWRSPITAERILDASVRLGDVRVGRDDDGGLMCWWDEQRPNEGGRTQIVRRGADGSTIDLLPAGCSAVSRVHEYGGAAWWLAGDSVCFVNDGDQRIWRLDPGRAPRPLTPEPSRPRGLRFADGVVSPDGRNIICVAEVHPGEAEHPGDRHEAVNRLVSVPVEGGEPTVLFDGSDFVSSPRLDATGVRLAWITWDHPSMPWDSTRLWVADLVDEGRSLADPIVVAGGTDESVAQPAWDREGRLWFISDRSDWWNLHRFVSPGRPVGEAEAVGGGSFEVAKPPWVFGEPRYGFLDDGRVVFASTADQRDALAVVDPMDGVVHDQPVEATSIPTVVASGDSVVFIGASFVTEPAIEMLQLPAALSSAPSTGPGAGTELQVLRPPRELGIEPTRLSVGQPVTFPAGDGSERAHALFYPPVNPDHVAPDSELPPLVVMIHGGPTSMAQPYLRLPVQFWTSRGFAVVDVNHRGSTGFGRRYRDRLRGGWGILDVDDCRAAAEFLAAERLVDRDRVLIRGGSAGGFTALAALAFTDTFAAGASLYGIGDLSVLATDTHKFESRYLDELVGPWPAAEAVYRERSPLHHADRIDRPVIVMQGMDDKVVPPNQAEAIVGALASRGVPLAYLTFSGEGHGFRQAATIRRALEAELSFYVQVLGIEHPTDIELVEVVGL